MKAYLIDPKNKEVTEVDYSGDFSLIDAPLVNSVRFTKTCRDYVYIDDEGLFRPDQSFFMIGEYPTPLPGKALVLGCDVDGETISPQTDIQKLKIRWVSL